MATPPAADSPALPRRLLVVDDEDKIREMLIRFFTMKGYDVRGVAGGAEALALLEAFPPDVVLLDLLMPGLNGIDTLKQLKQRQPHLKVIILSSADLEQVAQGALALGANYYVCKPPSLAEMERLVSGFWPSHAHGH